MELAFLLSEEVFREKLHASEFDFVRMKEEKRKYSCQFYLKTLVC